MPTKCMAAMPPPTSTPAATRESGCFQCDAMAKPKVAATIAVTSDKAVP